MKIISFNVNSIRSRLHQMETVCAEQADIICVQEIKAQDHNYPFEDIQKLGYESIICGQKSYHGVATLSTAKPISHFIHVPELSTYLEANDLGPEQARFVGTTHQFSEQIVHVYNGYFPQGAERSHEKKFPYKLAFYRYLIDYIKNNHTPDENVIITGDFNISPADIDIGIGEDNRKRWLRTGKCSFLPEERALLTELMDWGLTDTYRHLYPDADDKFSWFDYRSKGFDDNRGLRIDYVLCTKPLLEHLVDSGIDYETRGMEKPSDHAPVWSEFSI